MAVVLGEGSPVWATSGPRTIVRQQNGEPLELTERLGVGAQGEVWVAGSRHAVKLLHARTQSAADELHRRLRTVTRLDLQGLPLSQPLALLAPPRLGYVMELLEDMEALQKLASPPQREDLVRWYTRTGGLRRRLRLLARLADALARLHARGMAYGDPSPTNVLVSESAEHEQVWLIDVDNVTVVSELRAEEYMTPGYAAPELVAGRSGVTSLSDAFAFAVMTYETLAIVHPFIGDLVYDGEPELQERAFAGEIPWIHHEDDATNRSNFGFDWEVVLTPGLRELAQQTFAASLHDPVRRPTVAEWRTKLRQAADLTLRCVDCRGTFYVNLSTCPWCGKVAPHVMMATVHLYVPGEQDDESHVAPVSEALAMQRDQVVVVTGGTAVLDHEQDAPVVELKWDSPGRLWVRNVGDRVVWLVAPHGRASFSVKPNVNYPFPDVGPGERWTLHFGQPDEIHRLLKFVDLPRRLS